MDHIDNLSQEDLDLLNRKDQPSLDEIMNSGLITVKRRRKGDERELQANVAAHQTQEITPDKCISQTPPKYYCSLRQSCMNDCNMCGWKSVMDTEFRICVVPTRISCASDSSKVFCGADSKCHGSCESCVG